MRAWGAALATSDADVDLKRLGAVDPEGLSAAAAQDVLADLALVLNSANQAYHTDDDPAIDDATYDHLKRVNSAKPFQIDICI